MKRFLLLTSLLFLLSLPLFAQIANPGFEEWEPDGSGYERPVGWEVEDWGGCFVDVPYLEKSDDAYEGEHSLKLRGTCSFWEGGLAPAIAVYEWEVDGDLPTSITCWVKLINIEDSWGAEIGRGAIVVRHTYVEGGWGENRWIVDTTEEIAEWTPVEIPIAGIDPSKNVASLRISIWGGSVPNGIGYEGNADFLVDGIGISLTSVRESWIHQVRIYPNPAGKILYLEGAPEGRFELFDAMGRLAFQGASREQLDVGDLSAGLYTIRLWSEKDRQWIARAILKH
ncbi:MAG: T9SS type A sorting domain-containing protein [Saprospiraceae bacterium]|nr:T9SS type A sorting domain-containing protein [Saprospiraceae bacterium]